MGPGGNICANWWAWQLLLAGRSSASLCLGVWGWVNLLGGVGILALFFSIDPFPTSCFMICSRLRVFMG